MERDQREAAARYYDLQEFHDDLPFYESLVSHDDCSVLDLGCGTGRVLIPLAPRCAYIHGIELSRSMLAICREKLQKADIPLSHVAVEQGDISRFSLVRRFDLVIAPFRVFQALETDEQVEACLQCIRNHLTPRGSAVLSMFNPDRPPDEMRRTWVTEGEMVDYECELGNGERLVCLDRRPRLDPDHLVLYPELIYRRYRGDELLEEVVMPIAMRCWYPDQFLELLDSHNFRILNTWGGYNREPWGEGPELVVQFANAR